MDIQTTVIELIDNLFMEDISDMMDEDLFDAGVLDSMGTVELVIELESKFNIKIPVSDMGRDKESYLFSEVLSSNSVLIFSRIEIIRQ